MTNKPTKPTRTPPPTNPNKATREAAASCTCTALTANMDPQWRASEAEPHHPDCPSYVVTAAAVTAPAPAPKELPLPVSSFVGHAGAISEVTWTSEDDVIRYRKWGKTDHDTLVARQWLRQAAKQGIITARRNPEHGFWEYGPQWRAKDFQVLLDAAQAAVLLGAKV